MLSDRGQLHSTGLVLVQLCLIVSGSARLWQLSFDAAWVDMIVPGRVKVLPFATCCAYMCLILLIQSNAGIITHSFTQSGTNSLKQAQSGVIKAQPGITRHNQARADMIRRKQAASGSVRHS